MSNYHNIFMMKHKMFMMKKKKSLTDKELYAKTDGEFMKFYE